MAIEDVASVVLGMIGQRCPEMHAQKPARAFLNARKMVPSRPHPAAPQTGGIAQKAADSSVHDTIVETASRREFAALKYQYTDSGI